MSSLFMETNSVKAAAIPQDNVAAITGSTVKLQDFYAVAIKVNLGASTGAAVDLTLKQHDGTTPKALDMVNPYFKKVAAETVFTKVDAPNADTLDLAADFADDSGMVVIEVLAEDLDRNNGYHSVSLDLGAATVAKIVAVEYVMYKSRFNPAYENEL